MAQWYIYLFFRLSEQYRERVTDQRSKNGENRAKRAEIGNFNDQSDQIGQKTEETMRTKV